MAEAKKTVEFSVSRHDLLYAYPDKFEDVFYFAPDLQSQLSNEHGVRRQEHEGYDFKSECKPRLVIKPCADLFKQLGYNPDDYTINVTIEDIGLGIRKLIYVFPVTDLEEGDPLVVDLKIFAKLSFARGFEIRCFITRTKSLSKKQPPLWHKSQVLFETEFLVRATSDDALFEINWMNFSDDGEKAELLYYVKWLDTAVSEQIPSDCFQVIANEAHRFQFKRLENNSQFGHFSIRLIAQAIVAEITMVCLANANRDKEPEPESLHEKIQILLKDSDLEFDELARRCQSKDSSEVVSVQNDVFKYMQRIHLIGSELQKIRFGGFRRQ